MDGIFINVIVGGTEMVEAYCVKCRKKVQMADAKEVKLKNGKPAMKGSCPTCGTGVFRIGKPKS